MIRLPLRRICEKHGCPVIDIGTGDKDKIVCENGHHRCDEWLVVDADDMCVAVGHKDDPGTIFTVPTPMPKPKVFKAKPCRHGHMDWVAVGVKGTLRCSTCYSTYQKKYRDRKRKERKNGRRNR